MIRDQDEATARRRLYRFLAIVAAMMLVAATPAFAGGKKSGSIELSESNPYSFGQQVTFDVSTENITQPWVSTKCYQDGEIVYAETHSPGGTYTLGPTSKWHGGDAECTATLFWQHRHKRRTLDSVQFSVVG